MCDANMRMFISILVEVGKDGLLSVNYSGGDIAATGTTFARFRIGHIMEFIVT